MRLSFKSWLMLGLVAGSAESFVIHNRAASIRSVHSRPSASSSSRRHLAPPVDIHALTGAVQTAVYPLVSSFQSHAPGVNLHSIAEAFQQVSTITHLHVPAWLTAGWETYSSMLREKPVATKAATAAILCFTGDAVAQARTTSEEPYDIRRGLAFLAFGALYTGCFQHHWFSFLQQHVADWGENIHIWGHPAETNIPVSYFMQQPEWWQYFDIKHDINVVMETLQDPPSPAELALAKVAVNQFVVIPSIYMPLFFVVTGIVAGLDWNKIVARAQSLYLPLLQRNYMFWIPTQFAQFLLIPVDYQVPFVCIASLCWTIILSSIGGSSAQPASPSTIVAYEQQETESGDSQEPLVTVMAVDAGPVNELTDEVLVQDVRDSLVPESIRDTVERVGEDVKDVLAIPQVGASASGLAFGLLASATDEATVGAAVGAALGIDESVGIAVVAAIGAGAGYMASQAIADDGKEDEEITTKEQFGHEYHSSYNATVLSSDAFMELEAQKGR